jgi:preprotein translocase subunit SecA
MFAEKLKEHRAVTSVEADKVRQAGGLFILGTERHEARRIDNQLRGRAGRQGDPGETRFYIALTDDIMRLFGSERIMGMMEALGLEEDMPIDKKMLSNAIESAQRRVESRNFQSRKSVLEYDDVMNTQRTIVYNQRRKVLDGDDITANIQTMISETIETHVDAGFAGLNVISDRSMLAEVLQPLEALFLSKGEIKLPREGFERSELEELLDKKAAEFYQAREAEFGITPGTDIPLMRELERVIMLRVVDEFWMDHIDAMESLRDSVRLRAYAQTNPVDEYKREGFNMFEEMIGGIKEEVVRRMFTVRVRKDESLQRRGVARNLNASAQNVGGDASIRKQPVRKGQKIGRNDPCPCGKKRPNGLPMKYKDCCGRNG